MTTHYENQGKALQRAVILPLSPLYSPQPEAFAKNNGAAAIYSPFPIPHSPFLIFNPHSPFSIPNPIDKLEAHAMKKYIAILLGLVLLIQSAGLMEEAFVEEAPFVLAAEAVQADMWIEAAQEGPLGLKETVQLSVQVSGDDPGKITWKSSDTKVATVSSAGKVTGKAAGTAVITATAADGRRADWEVEVQDVHAPTSITIMDPGIEYLGIKDTLTLNPIMEAIDTPQTKLKWKSSNAKVAAVSNGKVTGKGAGTATITVTTGNGLEASVDIEVKDTHAPTSIEIIDPEIEYLGLKDSITLDTLMEAIDTPQTKLTWKSSNAKVASISKGKVTGKGEGTATITVTTGNGLEASIDIEVKDIHAPTSLKIVDPEIDYLGLKESITLDTEMTAIGEPQTKLTWKSSDAKVASVSKGKVTGKAAGTATITVTSANGLSASIDIEVKDLDPSAPTSIAIVDPEIQYLGLKDTLTLETQMEAIGTPKSKLTWKTSNAKVASVSNGKVTGKGEGTATITVTTANGLSASIDLEVKDIHAPTSIAIVDPGIEYLGIKDVITLETQMEAIDTPQSKLTWKSSVTKVAVVSNGKVTGKSAGTTTITVTTANGLTASIDIEVKDIHAPTSIAIVDPEIEYLGLKDTLTLEVEMEAIDTPQTKLTWKSSATKVAAVAGGRVTGKAAGTATITVTTANGLTASIDLEVKDIHAPTAVAIAPVDPIGVGETVQLTAELQAIDTPQTKLTWSTSDKKVATVSNAGLVKGIKAGTATITVLTANGLTASVDITVSEGIVEVTGVSLSQAEAKMTVGGKLTLTATVTPDNATSPAVTWSSSDEAVATVNGGLVSAVAPGTATITAQAGDCQAQCLITVTDSTGDFEMADGVILSYAGPGGTVIIPEADGEGNPITTIGENAFRDNGSITRVVATSESLVEIGASAFEGCGELATVELPDSVRTIGKAAFKNCAKLEEMD